MSDAANTTNGGTIIGIGALSIVSTVGMIGTCVWNYRDKIFEKMKCVITFGGQQDDAPQPVPSVPPALPPTPPPSDIEMGRTSAPTQPSITFPIIINNSSGLEGRESYPVSLPFISPFDARLSSQGGLVRHHSDPQIASSDGTSEDADNTSNESPPVQYRVDDGYQTS